MSHIIDLQALVVESFSLSDEVNEAGTAASNEVEGLCIASVMEYKERN
jgi:hypothetical protein